MLRHAPGSGAGTSRAVLMVRPHRIQFAQADQTDSVLVGIVASVVYLGDRVRISVAVPECGEVLVDAAPNSGARPREGDSIRLVVPPDACRVV